jgi:hypothetical protein
MHAILIDGVGAERVLEMALGDRPRRGLGGEDGDLVLVGERLHGEGDRAVLLTDHRRDVILGSELAEGGQSFFRCS